MSTESHTAGSPARTLGIQIEQALTGPPHEGDAGRGLLLRTTRGDIPAILHAPPDAADASGNTDANPGAVVWVCGARGGFAGPAGGLYAQLAQEFADQRGIASLRLDYRQPNNIQECALDIIAGLSFLKATGRGPAVLVGHSFGGAVVIAAGSLGHQQRHGR